MSEHPQTETPPSGRKIVGIISFYNVAGAPQAMLRIARQLRARGHDFEVWFLYAKAEPDAGEGFTRTILSTARPTPLDYLRLPYLLFRALRQAGPDAVLSFLPLGNVLGQTSAWLAGVRRRVASQRSPGTTYGRVMRVADRVVGTLPAYQRVICVSQGVADSFEGYPQDYRRKIGVIHNGIQWTPSTASKAEARASLGVPHDIFLLVSVGRLEHQKNYGLLIEALATVPDTLLLIAGDGSLEPELSAQAERYGVRHRVRFLGALPPAQVRDLLRAADAFAQSSHFEGQSNAVLEAMHARLPIVLGEIPEQRETLVDPDTGDCAGMLVPLDDPAGWAQALNAIRTDPSLRETLGARAEAMVLSRFSLDRMVGRFEQALQ